MSEHAVQTVQFLTLSTNSPIATFDTPQQSSNGGAMRNALPRSGAHVFCWPAGWPFTVDYATHALHRATVTAGIPDLRQHDLRHGFAIRRLRGGANLVAVSGLLRHASTRMTERYLHVTRADLRAAVEAGHTRADASRTIGHVDALLQCIDANRD